MEGNTSPNPYRLHCHRLGKLVMGIVLGSVLISCGGSEPRPVEPPETSYSKARDLYERNKWDKAKIEFEQFIFNYPGTALVDSAQYFLAMCNYNVKDFVIAADEFLRLRRRYPTSPLVEEADYRRALSLLSIAPENPSLDQGQTQDAIRELRLFQDLHPLSPLIPAVDSLLSEASGRLCQSDFKTARLYHRMSRYNAARIYWQEVVDRCSESALVPEAVYYIAEGYRKLDSLDRGIEYYEKLIYVYPDHKLTDKAKKRIRELSQRRDQLRAMEEGNGN